MQATSAWRSALIPGIVLALILVIGIPLLNMFDLLSDYYLNLFGKYLALAILALGMDLLWGYTGILSLGQAIFFGFGAYSMGMYLMLASSGQGVYGEPIPDFMVWNRVTELPLFWKPYQFFPVCRAPGHSGADRGGLGRWHADLSAPRRRDVFCHPDAGHGLCHLVVV